MKVAVLGAGLAGLSTAVQLVKRGAKVTLVEKRPFAGGRAFSFLDAKSGAEIDNGQHVFLACCTALIDFIRTVGAWERVRLQRRARTTFIDLDTGRRHVLGEAFLPAPLHLGPSLLTFGALTWGERFAVLRAGTALDNMSEVDLVALDAMSFEAWLLQRGQSPRAIERFWNIVILATLNCPVSKVSAMQAAFVFREGFLASRSGLRVAYAKGGLSEIFGRPAVAWLHGQGVETLFGRGVTALHFENGRVARAALGEGGAVEADAFVSAMPHTALWKLLPDALRDHAFFHPLEHLGTSPIVNVHLFFDRPVMDVEFAALLGGRVQWVFNHAMMGDPPSNHVAMPFSGAQEYVDMPREAIVDLALADLRRAFPAAGEAKLLHSSVIKEMEATFAAAPGTKSARLTAQTPIENLFLAGDFTNTGWPSTMEGAVRSGLLAAAAVTARGS